MSLPMISRLKDCGGLRAIVCTSPALYNLTFHAFFFVCLQSSCYVNAIAPASQRSRNQIRVFLPFPSPFLSPLCRGLREGKKGTALGAPPPACQLPTGELGGESKQRHTQTNGRDCRDQASPCTTAPFLRPHNRMNRTAKLDFPLFTRQLARHSPR